MSLKRKFSYLLAISLLSGCMTHGDTPISYGPDNFSTLSNSSEKNLSEYPWWNDIGSDELNELVNNALSNNKKIALSVKAIEGAQASLDTIKLGWLPIFSFIAGRANGNSTINLPNLPIPIANSGGFAAFLPIWIANVIQLPNQMKEAQKNVDASASEYLALRTIIAAQTVSSYVVLLASIEEDKILLDLKSNLKLRIDTLTQMTNRGLTNEISLIDLNSEMNKLDMQISTNKSNKIAARNALMNLLGKQIETFEPKVNLSQLNLNHIAPGNTPTSVLATRPDVVAARAKIEASDYGVSSAISLFAPIPTFTTANLKVNSSNNNVDSSASSNMQAGLALWVLDPKFIGAIYGKNKMYDASIIKYLDTVDNAVKEVDNNLADFDASQSRLKLEESSINNTNTNLNTYKAMYQKGLISNTQYLETEARFDLAKIAILQTKVQTIISLSKLYQSMGGGATYREKNYTLKDQTILEKENENAKD